MIILIFPGIVIGVDVPLLAVVAVSVDFITVFNAFAIGFALIQQFRIIPQEINLLYEGAGVSRHKR